MHTCRLNSLLAVPLVTLANWTHCCYLQVLHQLAQRMPPIEVVTSLPEVDQWAAMDVDPPFSATNDLLGVQLDRRVVHRDLRY